MYGYTWICIYVHKYTCNFRIYVKKIVHMDIHRCTWICMYMHGYAWMCIDVHRCPHLFICIHMYFHVNTWICMYMHGYICIYMDMHGYPCRLN